jgi:hypothetical protein
VRGRKMLSFKAEYQKVPRVWVSKSAKNLSFKKFSWQKTRLL